MLGMSCFGGTVLGCELSGRWATVWWIRRSGVGFVGGEPFDRFLVGGLPGNRRSPGRDVVNGPF